MDRRIGADARAETVDWKGLKSSKLFESKRQPSSSLADARFQSPIILPSALTTVPVRMWVMDVSKTHDVTAASRQGD